MANEGRNILIIEDESLMASALKKKLESEGLGVVWANDGLQGLNIALQKHPDLILLDIVLPSMDGMTLLSKLREDEWGKNVPVIILSNLSRAATIEEGKEKGVNTYLVKTDWKLGEVAQKVKHELGLTE